MKLFKNDGKEDIPGSQPVEVSLEGALQEIDAFPEAKKDDDFFIGFVNDKDETVQFIKNEGGTWFVDAPVVENGEYRYSMQADEVETATIKDIVMSFFGCRDWKTLCKLERA